MPSTEQDLISAGYAPENRSGFLRSYMNRSGDRIVFDTRDGSTYELPESTSVAQLQLRVMGLAIMVERIVAGLQATGNVTQAGAQVILGELQANFPRPTTPKPLPESNPK